MRTGEATEQDQLERLRHDELALERQLADARRDAAAVLELGRQEADAVGAEARRLLEVDLAALRAAADAELGRAREAARAAAEEAVAELARRAERNRARAIARAVAVVLG